MSQKTVPVLIASIAVLFISLVVIIVVMLNTPERKSARENRVEAVGRLLASRALISEPDIRTVNLSGISSFIMAPAEHGGSLDNLNHYLSKDPGRRSFSRRVDRKRAEDYLAGDVGESALVYSQALEGRGYPGWVPEYAGTVRALFEEVVTDVLTISGIPDDLTTFKVPETPEDSAVSKVEGALLEFGKTWVPKGETNRTYDTDRREIREFLLGNKRFLRRLESMDHAWRTLNSALYNLSVHPRWLMAVDYDPDLERELNEVITVLLTADLNRRTRDIMGLIPGEPSQAGIMWLPEMSYYKNIPEITGQTADEVSTIYVAKVNLGYKFRDSRTQTWLNRRKDWLTDYFQAYFSGKVMEDFSPLGSEPMEYYQWKTARMKAEGIHGINQRIIATLPFGEKGVFGVRDLAMVRVNLLENP